MSALTLPVPPEAAGGRVDAWLADQREDLTRSAAARLLEDGQVTCDGKPLPKNYRLRGGESLTVTLPEVQETELLAQDIPLDVVYEDGDVIVLNKPKGLVVHPAPGHADGTLVNALLHHCGDSLSGIGGEKRPGIVHRIDRDTSGLIIAAKNDFAHQKLSAQLSDHSLARTYECIVIGNLREDSGTAGTGRRWRWSRTAAGPSPIGRSSPATRASPTSAAGWRPGAPTRSGSTWPISATPSWGTRSTGRGSPCRGSRASAFTPWGCASSIPGPGRRWSSPAPCRRSSSGS